MWLIVTVRALVDVTEVNWADPVTANSEFSLILVLPLSDRNR